MNNFFNPFFVNRFPKPKYLPQPNFNNNSYSSFQKSNINTESCNNAKFLKSDFTEKPIFEILGIKLYSDDLLILALIFFLYKENITDTLLLLALFSLLF